MERGFADYRSNMRSIAAVARANRIPLVLPQVVLPFPGDGAEENCAMCDGLSPLYGGVEPDRVKAMFGRYDSVLAELAAEGGGVHHIRTEGFVPRADRYYNDPVHFGPEGSRMMGTKLAEALQPLVNLEQSGD
jgi:lysophospholipase L1-like esterase